MYSTNGRPRSHWKIRPPPWNGPRGTTQVATANAAGSCGNIIRLLPFGEGIAKSRHRRTTGSRKNCLPDLWRQRAEH